MMDPLAFTVEELDTAVRRERNACAILLENEAAVHEAAAEECLHEEDGDEEAGQHIWDAETLRRMAARIRARGNPEPVTQTVIPDDEIRF